MASRLKLHEELEKILGNKNVYYQPPNGITMKYPAIRYRKSKKQYEHADDKKYKKDVRYEITVISKTPDHEAIDKILEMEYSNHERVYVIDNLYHDVISLYY